MLPSVRDIFFLCTIYQPPQPPWFYLMAGAHGNGTTCHHSPGELTLASVTYEKKGIQKKNFPSFLMVFREIRSEFAPAPRVSIPNPPTGVRFSVFRHFRAATTNRRHLARCVHMSRRNVELCANSDGRTGRFMAESVNVCKQNLKTLLFCWLQGTQRRVKLQKWVCFFFNFISCPLA